MEHFSCTTWGLLPTIDPALPVTSYIVISIVPAMVPDGKVAEGVYVCVD